MWKGSPSGARLTKLKHWVVAPQFITHDSWSFNQISIYVIKFLPYPNFVKMELRKLFSKESKAVSISIASRNPLILNQSLISTMSEINLLLSQ